MSENDISRINSALDEIKAELLALKERLEGLENKLASGSEDIKIDSDDGNGSQEESSAKQVEVFRDVASGRVFLSFSRRRNKNNKPIFELFPSDTSSVKERVFVKSGSKINLIPESREVGDAGKACWKVDVSQGLPLMDGSARIPKDIQLFIEERFIKEEK